MTNISAMSRMGFDDGVSDGSFAQDNHNFKEVWAGEVFTAFEENNVMKDLHIERTITNGKSASFPATWKANSRYHVPGTPVLGSNQFPHKERIINIDDLLLSDTFVYNLDELKNYYEVRSIYSDEQGKALARAYDQKCLQVAILAARANGIVTGSPGGSVIKNTSMATDGEVLAGALFSAAQTFDEKDVPETDRHCVVKPAQYYLLAQTTKVINKDWDGRGSYATGDVVMIADIPITKSNNIPQEVVGATAGENNDYTGDFSNTVASVFHRQAIGTVKLMDLAVQLTGNDFNAMYQGDMLITKMAIGHGYLRPEAAIELSKSA